MLWIGKHITGIIQNAMYGHALNVEQYASKGKSAGGVGMSEIRVGDMIEVVDNLGCEYFQNGDKAKILSFDGGTKADFNQPGQAAYEDGIWFIGKPYRFKKIEKKSPERGIRIKVEKYEDESGNRLIKVLGIEALTLSELPKEYSMGESIKLGSWRDDILFYKNGTTAFFSELLKIGESYLQNDFEACMEIIKRCGKRLEEINKKNRTKKKAPPPPAKKRVWSGEKEYVI
jgi:hypothetical protein